MGRFKTVGLIALFTFVLSLTFQIKNTHAQDGFEPNEADYCCCPINLRLWLPQEVCTALQTETVQDMVTVMEEVVSTPTPSPIPLGAFVKCDLALVLISPFTCFPEKDMVCQDDQPNTVLTFDGEDVSLLDTNSKQEITATISDRSDVDGDLICAFCDNCPNTPNGVANQKDLPTIRYVDMLDFFAGIDIECTPTGEETQIGDKTTLEQADVMQFCNPSDQLDTDGDMIGDVCDNCPLLHDMTNPEVCEKVCPAPPIPVNPPFMPPLVADPSVLEGSGIFCALGNSKTTDPSLALMMALLSGWGFYQLAIRKRWVKSKIRN